MALATSGFNFLDNSFRFGLNDMRLVGLYESLVEENCTFVEIRDYDLGSFPSHLQGTCSSDTLPKLREYEF